MSSWNPVDSSQLIWFHNNKCFSWHSILLLVLTALSQQDGFYGSDCSACSCSPHSLSSVCDKETGACTCPDNFTGRRCDQCVVSNCHFSFSCSCVRMKYGCSQLYVVCFSKNRFLHTVSNINITVDKTYNIILSGRILRRGVWSMWVWPGGPVPSLRPVWPVPVLQWCSVLQRSQNLCYLSR